MSDYKIEAIQEIFEEGKLAIPSNNICKEIVEFFDSDNEMQSEISMYKTGWTLGQKCEKDERIKELENKLNIEEQKIKCESCNGYGYTVSLGGTLRSEHTCHKCNGRGRL